MNILSQVFDESNKTEIPLVYSARRTTFTPGKPLWISLIGPSGAGKDTLKRKLITTNRFYNVLTATNRTQRQGELSSEYIWMRPRRDGEPEHAYLRSVIREYDLFEYNYHYGNMYGTPYSSIKNALLSKKIVLYCSENQGALFMEHTLTEIFNMAIISVIPDSIEDMEQRIREGSRNNPTSRLNESMEKIQSALRDSHFVLKNPSNPIEMGKSGLDSAAISLRRLVEKLANESA